MHLDDGIVWLVVRDLKCYSLNLKNFVDAPIIPNNIRSSHFLLCKIDNKLQALFSKMNLYCIPIFHFIHSSDQL